MELMLILFHMNFLSEPSITDSIRVVFWWMSLLEGFLGKVPRALPAECQPWDVSRLGQQGLHKMVHTSWTRLYSRRIVFTRGERCGV